MEDATITQEPTQELYQQGKYPSVIDTDDLVFELGKQLIGNINKEKLLDNLLQKGRLLEQMAVEAKKESLEAIERKAALEESNKQYIVNNQKLDTALVQLRSEMKALEIKLSNEVAIVEDLDNQHASEITDLKKKHSATLKNLRKEHRAAIKELMD